MKRVINGKRYDTDTAQPVAQWFNDASYTDFNFLMETLYRKKTGEFFLHGEGGAMTSYAEPVELGGMRGGENLRPLSTEQAKYWCERYANDQYSTLFGEPTE